jgi:hypothetical protein
MLRILAIAVLAVASLPSRAADAPTDSRQHRHYRAAPGAVRPQSTYPLSPRAQAIRRADGCWRGCEANAGRALQACLRISDVNGCVRKNDAADRRCLSACRLYGGPLVNLAE